MLHSGLCSITFRQLPVDEIISLCQQVHIDGIKKWLAYLKLIHQLKDDRYVILEFVKDNAPEQFLEDAKVLRAMLGGQGVE